MALLGAHGSVLNFCERSRELEAARRGRRHPGGPKPDVINVHASIDWYIWRPVFSEHTGHVSRREIDEHWSILDLLECHELIDIHEELDRRAATKAQKKHG